MAYWKHLISGRKLRSSRYLLRSLFILGFLLVLTLLLPRSPQKRYLYEVGSVWRQADVVAPFDFAVYKHPDTLRAQQARMMASAYPVYVRDTGALRASEAAIRRQAGAFFEALAQRRSLLAEGDSLGALQISQQVFEGSYAPPQYALWERWLAGGQRDALLAEALRLAGAAHARGYLDRADSAHFLALRLQPGREALTPRAKVIGGREELAAFLRSQPLSEAYRPVLGVWLAESLRPSLRYDEGLSAEARSQQAARVSPLEGKVARGERIVGQGQLIDAATAARIESLQRQAAARIGDKRDFAERIGQFWVVLMLTLLLFAYLSVNHPRIYFSNTQLGLILFIVLLGCIALVAAAQLTPVALRLSAVLGPDLKLSYIYLAPVCIVPIFISNFFDERSGFLANLIIALYGGLLVEQHMEYIFVQIIAGTVVVFSLHQLRKRDVFYFTLGYVFLAYAVSYLAFNLVLTGSFAEINYYTLLLFAINLLLSMVAFNLIYPLERIFGVTSDLTYLELLDTNHPALQELARKAPGTFQHSLNVASIAEATAHEIGANALLAHVGALYHDIGKVYHHKFFIENMSEEERQDNPHNRIGCTESAEIIIGHVRKGVELAQRYRLPQEVTAFIETHHGTTRVEYFYRIFLKENQCEEPSNEEKFRYPGPIPYTKEAAVVMISDSVEAASRAMRNPTPEKLRELVDSIIDFKIKEKQLENSTLTFRDISQVRKVIYRQLLSMFHGRIEYPKAPITV